MPVDGSTEAAGTQVCPRWDRMRAAAIVAAYGPVARCEGSQREFAEAVGVPRTTLQYWLARKAGLDAEPALVDFFESPVGLAFLHRLVGRCTTCLGRSG